MNIWQLLLLNNYNIIADCPSGKRELNLLRIKCVYMNQ